MIWVINLLCLNTIWAYTVKENKFEGEIVFDKAHDGFHIFRISGMAPYKEIQLTQKDPAIARDNIMPKWSPNGTRIAYVNRETSGKSNIFVIDPDGKNKKNITSLTHGIIVNLKWDNNGNEIHFTYNPNKPGEEITGKIVDVRTGVMRDITKKGVKLKACDSAIRSPNEDLLICTKWLMPGKEKFIIYHAETIKENGIKKILSKITKQAKKDEEVISCDDTEYKKKTEMILQDASEPLWDRDSLRFAILIGSQLTIFDKSGSKTVRVGVLCKNEGASCLRTWSQDSKRILYSCYCGAEEIQEKIYIYDLETKKSIYITEGQNPDWYFPAK